MKYLLCELEKGCEGVLLELPEDCILARRLRQFGMIEGTKIRSIGTAPFGSPMLFRIRGSTVALRTEDCRELYVVII